LVHRDIKPSNVFWYWRENEPHFLLAEFGLATDPDTAEFEIPAGTLSYMAPEALISRVPEAAGDVDVWSAGVIFAELVRPRTVVLPR
jgi:serine/threonine protein kinase